MSHGPERDTSPSPGARDRVRDSRGLRDFRYRAFISYSHEDKSWADWLIKSLETYRVPPRLVGTETAVGTLPRRLSPVFRDRDELASASDLGDTIREALADSATLIVICSPASANSHWVNEEIRAFQQLGRGDRILCLIVDGVPNASDLPGQGYKECFAPALRHSGQPGDGPRDHHTEPIAPDVRDDTGGRNAARLKLIAGLLGVGFDVLKRRHQQRRMRNMVAVTGLALVVTLVTSALAITAVIARHNAEVARQAAERRQKQAEGLINFMLGDLNDKLTEVGRLDIMQSVADRAMTYFASLPVDDVTDQSLAQRATALQQIGMVRQGQGHLDKALQSFLLALEINKRRLQQAPGDTTRLSDYGNSLTYVGFAYWYKQEIAQSGRYFRAANQALSRALSSRPNDPDIQDQLFSVTNNLALTLERRNKLDQAMAKYQQQITLVQKMLSRDPHNNDYLLYQAQTHLNISGLDLESGQLLHSIRNLHVALNRLSAMVKRDPKNRKVQNNLMITYARLALTLHSVGRQQPALHYIQRAVATGTSLVRFDPDNFQWKLQLSLYSIWQARWKLEIHPDSPSARHALEQQRRDLNLMLASNPTSTSTKRLLALTRLSQSSADLTTGHLRLAEKNARLALSTLPPLPRRTLKFVKPLRVACSAELILNRLDHSHGERTHAVRALQLIQPVARQTKDPRTLSLWVNALLETGHRKQALPVIRTLQDMGYRTPELASLLARKHLPYTPNPVLEDQLDSLISAHSVASAGNGSPLPDDHDPRDR